VKSLLQWVQSPWFNLAEGDYPYESAYIPFALGEGMYALPAWPLQEACHGPSGLHQNMGISIVGDRRDVRYSITYGDDTTMDEDRFVLDVDWNRVTARNVGSWDTNNVALRLFSSVREAISVWFNVTKQLTCFDVDVVSSQSSSLGDALSLSTQRRLTASYNGNSRKRSRNVSKIFRSTSTDNSFARDGEHLCQQKIDAETVWTSIVCNENLYLITTFARGVGGENDFF